ncbi:uncharacterized protein RJT21DRAFT_123469 [Scheffersomyces amazonensis]|uniref:uncharacterized protein n=1 Tax=Scheffersomyces amazonensis TaxID=1078765 RepID=UPI00315C59F7
MGACISCLLDTFYNNNDDEFNENSSLLRNNNNGLYSNDYLQQEEILKQQQRQQELNSIVNDLNENLIDVSSFLNTGVPSSNLSHSHVLSTHSNTNLQNSTGNIADSIEVSQSNNDSSFNPNLPYTYSSTEKLKVLQQVNDLDQNIGNSCKVVLKEPLFLNF